MSLRDWTDYGNTAERLIQAISGDHIEHAYLFEGDGVTDKLGFSLDFVKAVLCREKPGFGCGKCSTCRKVDHGNYEDLIHVTPDEKTGNLKDESIEQMQRRLMSIPAAEGGRNIAIIESAETMTARAQNRLLKTLEEPLPGTILILLTSNSENIIQTIKSRCVKMRLAKYDESLAEALSGSTNYEYEGKDKKEAKYIARANSILGMILENQYFYLIKDEMDKAAKDRMEAQAFLDAMERVVRVYMIRDGEGGGLSLSQEKAIQLIQFIEQTRREILQGVNYKYALRSLAIRAGM